MSNDTQDLAELEKPILELEAQLRSLDMDPAKAKEREKLAKKLEKLRSEVFSNIRVTWFGVVSTSNFASGRAIIRNGPMTMQCFAGSRSRFRNFAVSCAAGRSGRSASVPAARSPPESVAPAGTGS